MKRLAAALTFIVFLVLMFGVNAFTYGRARRLIISWVTSKFSKLFLNILDFKVNVIGELPKVGNYLVIANHLSYVDVITVATLCPGVFVTSEDIRREKVSGLVAKLAGCIQVDRKGFKTLLYDIKEMSCLLGDGHNVILFPEATTSSGNILPFKPSLITSAGHGGVPVLALSLRYKDFPLVSYHGEMKFLPHFLRFMSAKSLEVEVEVCGIFHPETDRKAFAKKLNQLIADKTHKY